MFRIFEIIKNSKKEVLPVNDLYTVFEFGYYEFEFSDDYQNENLIFIEDIPIRSDLIYRTTPSILRTKSSKIFEDFFGFAKVDINTKTYHFNILIEKLKVQEIEDILLYLFENNHNILDNFISKSSYAGQNHPTGKDFMYSSKYLNIIEYFCTTFEQLLPSFKNVPHTVVRKTFRISNYENEVVNFKSVEWLIQNLDAVHFCQTANKHPHHIKIFNKYGIIDKIASEKNELSFSTYENEIILGCFIFIIDKLTEIEETLNKKLTENFVRVDEFENEFTDFRNFKKLPFLKLQKDLWSAATRVKTLFTKFKYIFNDAKPRNAFPKLTPVFSKIRHYQKAFEMIRSIFTSEYDLDGQIQLLNVRKLSELYELYNLSVIIEEMKIMFGNSNSYDLQVNYTNKNEYIVSKFSYKHKFNQYSYTLFYEPRIKHEVGETDLILIGHSSLNINANYCNPDFVIEVDNSIEKVYHILDAKYTKLKSIDSFYKPICIKKYLIDVGISEKPYQKANNLILLHPDHNDPQVNLIHNSQYFPQIVSVVSKPNANSLFRNLIKSFK